MDGMRGTMRTMGDEIDGDRSMGKVGVDQSSGYNEDLADIKYIKVGSEGEINIIKHIYGLIVKKNKDI